MNTADRCCRRNEDVATAAPISRKRASASSYSDPKGDELHGHCQEDISQRGRSPQGDIRREPVGGFAGPIGTDAPIGSYASVPRRRGQSVGSFATGSFAGDPDQQREGSFADVERVVIVICNDEGEHSRVTGYRGVRRLLRSAALHDEAVDGAVKELHNGHAVVLVDVAEITPTAVRAHLEQVAQAA
jgi:hypothetical protein